MSHCQRCGATNEPTSRFCVACGAPLGALPSGAGIPAPATAAPPAPAQMPPGYSVPAQPNWSLQGAAASGAVVQPYEPPQPPSSGLQFAETAAPPTREEFEAQQAALAKMRAAGVIPPLGPHVPQQASPAAYSPAVHPATGAMPGVSQDPELIPDGAPRILAGFLVSYETHPLGRFWPLFQGKNRVGRHGAAPDLDVELDHPTTSSRHAMILATASPGRLKVEDTGSTNGTLVNGVRLQPGVRQELNDGDRVRFGLLSTIVKII